MSNYNFIEEAKNARKTAPASAWDRIEAKLDETQHVEVTKTKTFSLVKWSAAAAVVIAVATVGIFTNQKPAEIPVLENYAVTDLQDEVPSYFYSIESVKSLRNIKYTSIKS